jgi:polysaccharide export outer membrane protein
MKKLFSKLPVPTFATLGLVLGLGLLGAGCETTSSDHIRFSAVEGEEEYPGVATGEDAARFAKDDLVRITFSDTPVPPEPHEESIKEDGTITLPLIGPVQAAGKTTGELQKTIRDKYVPNYYKRLTVTVSTNRRVYYVSGQVRASGRQEYIGPTTVLKAIASAGDFNDFANRKKVILTRADGTRHTVDCIKAAKDSTFDLPVFPGDKIEVKMRIW